MNGLYYNINDTFSTPVDEKRPNGDYTQYHITYDFIIGCLDIRYAYKEKDKVLIVNDKRKALDIVEKEMDRLKKEMIKIMKIQFQIMEHEDKA